MQRLPVELMAETALDNFAQIHHRHVIGNIFHDRQIVRDEQIGQRQSLLQLDQQIDDLRLNRNIERRNRLVEHDKPRIDSQRTGNAHPLPLTAGEFVRIAVDVAGIEADLPQRFLDFFQPLDLVAHAMDDQAFFDDRADRHPRIERAEGILKHDLHVAAAMNAFRPAVNRGKIVRPSKIILPADGSMSRSRVRPIVVLPQPDSPTSPSVSPRPQSKAQIVDGPHVGHGSR